MAHYVLYNVNVVIIKIIIGLHYAHFVKKYNVIVITMIFLLY